MKKMTYVCSVILLLGMVSAPTRAGTTNDENYIKQFNDPRLALSKNASEFLGRLKKQGRLPGFQKEERAWILLWPATNTEHYPVILTLSARNKNVAGPFPYHYTVVKESETNDWQLQKAWRTDANGKTIEEFPIP